MSEPQSEAMIITMPDAVWEEYLNPDSTAIQAELGLPEPRIRRVGRGFQDIYEGVDSEVANSLADYLESRALMLLNQYDDGHRHTHRAAIKVARRIREAQTGPKRG